MNDTQDTTRHHQHTKVNANGDGVGGDAQCVCDRCTSHTLNAAARRLGFRRRRRRRRPSVGEIVVRTTVG